MMGVRPTDASEITMLNRRSSGQRLVFESHLPLGLEGNQVSRHSNDCESVGQRRPRFPSVRLRDATLYRRLAAKLNHL